MDKVIELIKKMLSCWENLEPLLVKLVIAASTAIAIIHIAYELITSKLLTLGLF